LATIDGQKDAQMKDDPPERGRTLSTQDVARQLGIKPRQLKNAISQGLLPGSDAGGGDTHAVSGFSTSWLTIAASIVSIDRRSIETARYARRVIPVKRPDGVIDRS
jgi:hypothetical protein